LASEIFEHSGQMGVGQLVSTGQLTLAHAFVHVVQQSLIDALLGTWIVDGGGHVVVVK